MLGHSLPDRAGLHEREVPALGHLLPADPGWGGAGLGSTSPPHLPSVLLSAGLRSRGFIAVALLQPGGRATGLGWSTGAGLACPATGGGGLWGAAMHPGILGDCDLTCQEAIWNRSLIGPSNVK